MQFSLETHDKAQTTKLDLGGFEVTLDLNDLIVMRNTISAFINDHNQGAAGNFSHLKGLEMAADLKEAREQLYELTHDLHETIQRFQLCRESARKRKEQVKQLRTQNDKLWLELANVKAELKNSNPEAVAEQVKQVKEWQAIAKKHREEILELKQIVESFKNGEYCMVKDGETRKYSIKSVIEINERLTEENKKLKFNLDQQTKQFEFTRDELTRVRTQKFNDTLNVNGVNYTFDEVVTLLKDYPDTKKLATAGLSKAMTWIEEKRDMEEKIKAIDKQYEANKKEAIEHASQWEWKSQEEINRLAAKCEQQAQRISGYESLVKQYQRREQKYMPGVDYSHRTMLGGHIHGLDHEGYEENRNLKIRVKELEGELNHNEKTFEMQRRIEKGLREENSILRANLKNLDERYAKLSKDGETLKTEGEQLKGYLSGPHTMGEYMRMAAELEELKPKLKTATDALEQAQGELLILRQRVGENQTVHGKTAAQWFQYFATTKTELNNLKEQVKEYQAANNSEYYNKRLRAAAQAVDLKKEVTTLKKQLTTLEGRKNAEVNIWRISAEEMEQLCKHYIKKLNEQKPDWERYSKALEERNEALKSVDALRKENEDYRKNVDEAVEQIRDHQRNEAVYKGAVDQLENEVQRLRNRVVNFGGNNL